MSDSTDPPPEYIALVQRMIRLVLAWVAKHPGAVLRWKSWAEETYLAPLGAPEAIAKLADSRDARRLLEWLDRRTGRQGSLLQACAALELAGVKPEEKRSELQASEVN